MNKTFMTIHRIVVITVAAAFLAGLVHFLTVLKGLPDVTGVHFDGSGDFDVYASKYYGFYPFIIGGLIISLLLFADKAVVRLSSGMSLGEKGENIFRCMLLISSDIIKALFCVFALNWSHSVIYQVPLNMGIMRSVFLILFAVILLMIIGVFILKGIFAPKKQDTGSYHRVMRLAAWMTSISELPITLLIWERFPEGAETTDPFAPIYYADLGTDAPKYLYILPALLSIAVCITGEIMTKRFGQKKGSYFIRAVDTSRMSIVFFLWARMLVMPDTPTNPVIAAVCAGICLLSVIVNIARSKRAADAK